MGTRPAEDELRSARERMVEHQVARRGIRDRAVLEAMLRVPREAFLPPELAEFAYEDHPLPIAEGQTISQPFIVALMTAAAELRPTDRVLEIGTGSGYAAAILGSIAGQVYTIERHAPLADTAAARLRALGLDNVHVMHGDGTLGWREHAPYDAIIVTAGGPKVPDALLAQLAVGGRLVIPVGEEKALQTLVRVRREADGRLAEETLGDVRFVPLVGAQGWAEEDWTGRPAERGSPAATVARLVREVVAPIGESIAEVDMTPLLERIGDARLVLIGEATHGTSEFYAFRAQLTKALIRSRGFTIVAAEADWPDAARIDRYVRGAAAPTTPEWRAFARFPTWMWRNHEVLDFVEWLRDWNASHRPAGFYGLDLYSMYRSIRLVLDYLDRVDPPSARVARERYACLMP